MNANSGLKFVGVYDIHGRSKSYELKFLEKLVIQHGIKALLEYIYISNLSSKPKRGWLWLFANGPVCVSPCMGMELHMRDCVRVHDIYSGPKSYKLKFLGKLVVPQNSCCYLWKSIFSRLLQLYSSC